jgi:predicted protein tyrosine phosphatase
MDEKAHIARLAAVLIECHGSDAENKARKRANRCLRRNQLEWAEVWRAVAERISEQRLEHAACR